MRNFTVFAATAGHIPLTLRLALAALAFALISTTPPLPEALFLRPLERRFPIWQDFDAKDIAGIVVLGGALNFNLERWTPKSEPFGAARRITATAHLGRQFPQAKIIYSGGGGTPTEAELGKMILVRLGVKSNRILMETKATNTAENAVFSRRLASFEAGERWLLVTSAFHMPRAVGSFRAAGFPVEAYPVDYRNDHALDIFGGFASLKIALREYLALIVYRATGHTQELFPAWKSQPAH